MFSHKSKSKNTDTYSIHHYGKGLVPADSVVYFMDFLRSFKCSLNDLCKLGNAKHVLVYIERLYCIFLLAHHLLDFSTVQFANYIQI